MTPSNDNRMVLIIGAVLAVLAAVVVALIFSGRGEAPDEAPPAAKGGLQLDVADAPSLEPTRQLRCFVNGQFVGMATLADCAQRNGLATEALDVGLDETGALAAAPTASFAPPPELPSQQVAVVEPTPTQPTTPAVTPVAGAACLRHTGSEWRQVSASASLTQCVQSLFNGTCVRPGDARYGRWGDMTLRLVPGRVEQSPDNNRFRALAEQDRACQFGAVG